MKGDFAQLKMARNAIFAQILARAVQHLGGVCDSIQPVQRGFHIAPFGQCARQSRKWPKGAARQNTNGNDGAYGEIARKNQIGPSHNRQNIGGLLHALRPIAQLSRQLALRGGMHRRERRQL